jgi:hypothetical protein
MVEQNLTWQQRHARLQFAFDLLRIGIDLKTIVFSNESHFMIGSDKQWRHIRRGCWNSTCFTKHDKFPESLMIWGAIGHGFQSACQFCSHSVDADEYQTIIARSEMVDRLDRQHGRFKWYFMQDGAPAHRARTTSEFFGQRCLILPGWPPNSPDLNPIEMIWGIVKTHVEKLRPETKEALAVIIQEVWSSLDQEMIDRLVDHFPERLTMVVQAQGRSISQYLSSHRKRISINDMHPDTSFVPWSEREDLFIKNEVERRGRKWRKIAEEFRRYFSWTRERLTIKHCADWLACVDRNCRLVAHPPLPHILEVIRRLLELAGEEQPVFIRIERVWELKQGVHSLTNERMDIQIGRVL